MADFSALKTSIQNYIKQNGNEEITGNLLQQILLSMVSTLGDSAINNLVAALNAEIANRGNADTELGGSITTLQGVVNGIKSNVENGYVYAGIATPSTTPVSGKVFYLALNAGTYTNFGATVVPQGINILKYNGSAWSLDSFLGLDDTPTQGSNNLVKSGGVLDSIIKDGSAFDLSAYNTGTTYADLSAALTALNALSAAYKKGGMSFKYVQSSDNNYIQYRLMSNSFSTTVTDWQGVDDEPTQGSSNLVKSGGVYELVNLPTPIDFTPIAGKIKNLDGTDFNWGVGSNTGKIRVLANDKILLLATSWVDASFSAIQVYDINGNIVENLKRNAVDGPKDNQLFTFERNFECDIICSYRSDSGNSFSIALEALVKDIVQENTQRIETLENKESIQDAEIGSLQNSVDVLNEGMVKKHMTVAFNDAGGYINKNGVEVLHIYYSSTDYIKGQSFKYSGTFELYNTDLSYGPFAFYDENKVFLQEITSSFEGNINATSTRVFSDYEFNMPVGAYYVRIVAKTSETKSATATILVGGLTRKIDKNVNFVGMSIWWYDGKVLADGVGGGVVAHGYQTHLKEQFLFKSTKNYCYSGHSLGGLSIDDTDSIIVRSTMTGYEWEETEDAIWTLDTITNDFKRNIPLGTIQDYENNTGITTYYGALRAFKDKVALLSTGESPIVIVGNCVRRNNSGYTSNSVNSVGCKIVDYEKALCYVAMLNDWCYVDQFRLCGVTDDNIMVCSIDGLHLNNLGFRLAVKPWIEQFDIIYNRLLQNG